MFSQDEQLADLSLPGRSRERSSPASHMDHVYARRWKLLSVERLVASWSSVAGRDMSQELELR